MGVGAGLGPGDPLARAVGRGGAAVEGRGELEHDVGPAGAAVDEVRGQLLGDGGGLDADRDLDAGGAQRGDAPPADERIRVLDADDDVGDARLDDRVDAR